MNEDGKYIRLFGTIFFTFLGFVGVLALLMILLRLIFGVLDHIPWFSLLFTFFIICVPAIIFLTVYAIYVVRTKQHPALGARIFSYIIFAVAIAAWLYFWVSDIFIFFKKYYNSIDHYNCYNLGFLSANVGIIFLVGIVQALSTKKEIGWLEKNKEQQDKIDTEPV